MKRLSFAETRAMQADLLSFSNSLIEQNGPVVSINAMGLKTIIVAEPTLIRELLIKHAKHLHRDQFTTKIFRRFLGNSVFTAEDASWRQQRKMLQPAFHASRIQDYTDIMATYTQEMVGGWQSGDSFAVDKMMTELTLRIIAKVLYDVDLQEQVEEIGRIMRELSEVVEHQLSTNAFMVPDWLPFGGNSQIKQKVGEIHAILKKIIADRRADGRDHGDLLSMLLSVRYEDGSAMSEAQLLDECVMLFFAGHETTAAALTWTWHLLMQNPVVVDRLRAEIEMAVGDKKITFSALAHLPLGEAVIKESMRLYPPAFGFSRKVIEPFHIGEMHFPKRSMLFFNTFALHRRADLYHNPDDFLPDRWLDAQIERDRYAYLPFGAGSRVCMGNMFAMLEARVILTTMLQEIDLVRADSVPVELDTVVTLRPKAPLVVNVERLPLKQPAR